MRLPYPSVLTAALLASACAPDGVRPPADPVRLVVMVSVDQLRGDLLDHYRPAFDDGFVRLMDGSLRFTGASHNHAATSTAIGHATLGTGVVPTRHGIVGNSWVEEVAPGRFQDVYSVEDTLSAILGVPDAPGRSPRNLYRDGLADWMLEADPATTILSIAKKDRGAIPLAGKARGHVYWIDERVGRFVTSTYYREEYPDWVDRFNEGPMVEIMNRPVWEQVVPEEFRDLARPDDAPYEGDGVHTTFPHQRRLERPGDDPGDQYAWASATPFPHEAMLGFLEVAMDELRLGTREDGTDYLALGFSQVDHVGHRYGPFSQEQLDNLYRLDRILGDVMRLLDERVGEGRWVMVLSADHGVMDIPEWTAERGGAERRITGEELMALRGAAARAARVAPTPAEIPLRVAEAVEALDFVEAVHLPEDLRAPPTDDSIAGLFGRSFSETRRTGLLSRYGVQVQLRPGIYPSAGNRGTGHGTPYWYDRHVPFIVYGDGITPGVSEEPVYTYDAAPTLAAFAGVPVPEDLDGTAVVRPGGS